MAGILLYPVSGPKSSPLQSTQAQSPSMKDMGSPQMGQSGAGPLLRSGRSGSSISSSSMVFLSFSLFDLQLNGFFRALSTRHSDKCQPPVDNGCRHGTDRMSIGQLLAVFRRNINFPIGEAVFNSQLLPQALSRRTGSTTGGHKQGDVRHR